jgi:hypothetical protein
MPPPAQRFVNSRKLQLPSRTYSAYSWAVFPLSWEWMYAFPRESDTLVRPFRPGGCPGHRAAGSVPAYPPYARQTPRFDLPEYIIFFHMRVKTCFNVSKTISWDTFSRFFSSPICSGRRLTVYRRKPCGGSPLARSMICPSTSPAPGPGWSLWCV